MLGEARLGVEGYVGAVRWDMLDVGEGKMGTFVAVIDLRSRLPGLRTLAAREMFMPSQKNVRYNSPIRPRMTAALRSSGIEDPWRLADFALPSLLHKKETSSPAQRDADP